MNYANAFLQCQMPVVIHSPSDEVAKDSKPGIDRDYALEAGNRNKKQKFVLWHPFKAKGQSSPMENGRSAELEAPANHPDLQV